MNSSVTVVAPAKTNLFLNVGALRKDGYHDVTTILCPLALHDTLTVTQTSRASSFRTSLTMEFEGMKPFRVSPKYNLVIRAVDAMCEQFNHQNYYFSINLVKRIPSGAGLGGGSADAAATVVALAHLWRISLDDPRINLVASGLGADVPFFLHGGATVMDGRGDRCIRSFEMTSIPAVAIKPRQSVPTPMAYRTFDRMAVEQTISQQSDAADTASQTFTNMLIALEQKDVEGICNNIYNNLSDVACEIASPIKSILTGARAIEGVKRCFVSGSGSAVIALCDSEQAANRVAQTAEASDYWYAVTHTSTEGSEITS